MILVVHRTTTLEIVVALIGSAVIVVASIVALGPIISTIPTVVPVFIHTIWHPSMVAVAVFGLRTAKGG